ncbi:MAG: GIY-YIG nuclease family protein [Trueperaceae bacterium]
MPLNARWRKLATLPSARGRDAMPGVYELAGEEKTILYIGQSATDVPNRIRQHLEKNSCVLERVAYWRYEYSRVPQVDEAKHIELYKKRFGNLPPCNRATPTVRDTKRRWLERSRG